MSQGIRLSPQHGVNPALGVCMWCGKEDGTVALLGQISRDKARAVRAGEVAAIRGDRSDAEAPRHVYVTDEPCDDCKANMARGITLIEAEGPQSDPTLTGRWAVVTEDCIHRVFDEAMADAVIAKGRAMIEPEAYELLGLHEEADADGSA